MARRAGARAASCGGSLKKQFGHRPGGKTLLIRQRTV